MNFKEYYFKPEEKTEELINEVNLSNDYETKVDLKEMEDSKGYKSLLKILLDGLNGFATIKKLNVYILNNHLWVDLDFNYKGSTRPYFVTIMDRNEIYEVGKTKKDYFELGFNCNGEATGNHFIKVANCLSAFAQTLENVNNYIAKSKPSDYITAG